MIQSAVNSAIGSIGSAVRMARIQPIIASMVKDAKTNLSPEQEQDRQLGMRHQEQMEAQAKNAYDDAYMNGRDADSVLFKAQEIISNGGRLNYFGEAPEPDEDEKKLIESFNSWRKSDLYKREQRENMSSYTSALKEKGRFTDTTYNEIMKVLQEEDKK